MKTVKRIMALGTGAMMVGATVLSASAAADLKNYPAPFVQDGKFNGVIVVGDNANAADVLGSVDVAVNLQNSARTKKTVKTEGGATVSATGELWRAGTSSKKLEMSESLGSGAASSVQETIQNITGYISKEELPVLLKDGTFRNDKGDFDYRQYLHFDKVNTQTGTNPASLSVIYAEDPDTDVTADYFYVKNGDRVARYSLEFTSSAESDVTDSAGATTTTGTYLWSMEGKDIELLGKTYSIVKARRTSSTGNGVELTLMGGATADALSEGESKTYTINGKDYEVSLDFVGTSTAKFTVNGQLTDSMQEGSTFTLADKSQIGVKDILAQDFAGGVRRVQFYLGADKVFLKDTDVSSAGAGHQTLEVGNEKVDDTKVTITGSDNNNTFKIDTIALNISADDDYYIPAEGKLSSQMEDPLALLNSWDLEYRGLESVPTETIGIKSSGSNQYNLDFVDGNGNEVSVPLAYSPTGTNLTLGSNSNALVISENTTIARNDYFLVSDLSQKQGDRRTFAVRYKGASVTGSSPVLKFQVLGESGTKEETYLAGTGDALTGTADATLKLGGSRFNVWNTTVGDDFNIVVDLDGDGSVDNVLSDNTFTTGGLLNVTTKAGAQILITPGPINGSVNGSGLAQRPLTSVNVSIQTVDSDDYDNVAPSPIDFEIVAASGKVAMNEISTWHNDINYRSPEGESNTNYAYTTIGARVKWDNPSNDPDTVDVMYPTVQRLPLVYITGPGAEITKGEGTEAGEIVYYEYSQISVGSAKLAGEVADIKAQNAIVIGGPCANAAAAELMDNPANCAEGFEAGKAMIKLYENGGKVAMLVAGYDALDTRRAARVVANYQQWQDAGKLKGMVVEVSGTSFTDISVAEPAPKTTPTAPADEMTAPPTVPADDNTTTTQ